MNIFVTDRCPVQSARNLPDKHIVKMPLETCQMLAIIYSDWYYGVGKLIQTGRHTLSHTAWCISQPSMYTVGCCQPVQSCMAHTTWLALCDEYTARYGKVHTCYDVIYVKQSLSTTTAFDGDTH